MTPLDAPGQCAYCTAFWTVARTHGPPSERRFVCEFHRRTNIFDPVTNPAHSARAGESLEAVCTAQRKALARVRKRERDRARRRARRLALQAADEVSR